MGTSRVLEIAGKAALARPGTPTPVPGAMRRGRDPPNSPTGVMLILKINQFSDKQGRRREICFPKPADANWHWCAGSCLCLPKNYAKSHLGTGAANVLIKAKKGFVLKALITSPALLGKPVAADNSN